jgi:hypothetical protein
MTVEQEIKKIKERNARVEADKAWETSIFRKVIISIFTYALTAIIFNLIGVKEYFLNALIPTLGYFLSVQSLPFIKSWWVEKVYKRGE